MASKYDPTERIKREREFRKEYTESIKNEGSKAALIVI